MRPALCFVFLPVAVLVTYACGHEHDQDEPAAGLEDVAFGGGATDEALLSLLAKLDAGAVIVDPAQAPTLTAPQDATLSAATSPTFSWQIGAATSGLPPTERFASWHVDCGARGPDVWGAQPCQRTTAEVIVAALTPGIDRAWAHGAPFTGYATLLVISNADSEALARAFTAELSFTPSEAVWKTVVNASQPVTLALVGALFDNNRVVEGPFEGSSVSLTIEP